jgi:pimeloyl-ACP methyl ester carboxylesterase
MMNTLASSTSYRHEEIFFTSTDNITIAGTLTLPNCIIPNAAVFLIAGMGQTDRDYTSSQRKKPYLILAEYLAARGIAVLRTDKRGVGRSTGTFDVTLTSDELAADVVAGIKFLKAHGEINPKKIGLVGHSEGGLIAAMVAAESKDVAFVVLLSPAIATTIDAVVSNTVLQLKADGASEEVIAYNTKINCEILRIIARVADAEDAVLPTIASFKKYWQALPLPLANEISRQFFALNAANALRRIKFFNSPWYRRFFTYNPALWFAKITIPVLAIGGELDWITSPDLAFPIISTGLTKAHNQDFELARLPRLNHSLQTCVTGAFNEYATIEEPIALVVLEKIATWFLARI